MYSTLWQDIVNAICDDDDIRAVSFVGSNTVSFLIMIASLLQLMYCIYVSVIHFMMIICTLIIQLILVVGTFWSV